MRVLVGFEESQAVCKEFKKLGHDAWSNDLQPCSGGHPEWHLQMDFFYAFEEYGHWDMVIAFPPCDHLSKAGAAHWKKPHKQRAQEYALYVVNNILCLPVDKLCMENPVGKISTAIYPPDQKIHPYQFGHPYTKETCLWLRGLPKLKPTEVVEPIANWVKPGNIRNRKFNKVPEGAGGSKKMRSKTFPGIAKAMAEQWS